MNKQLLDELDSYYKNNMIDDLNCCSIQSDNDGLNILDFTYGTKILYKNRTASRRCNQ